MAQMLESEEMVTEAEYDLERPVVCPSCRESQGSLQVVRMLRTKVNFTSTLPRRGYAIVCGGCRCVMSANIGARVAL